MAKIQYSALVTQMKGKLRGAIFQSGTAGQIVRSAKNWNRTSSQTWQTQKNRMAVVAQAWAALTVDQQNTWHAIAANMPTQNEFGEQRIPTGYNVFCQINGRALGTNGTLITSPTMPTQLTNIGTFETAAASPTFMRIIVGNVITASELLIVECSPTIGIARKNSPVGYKRIGNYYNPFTTIYDIIGDYTPVFGAPVVGGKVLVRGYVYNAITGQRSPAYINAFFIS